MKVELSPQGARVILKVLQEYASREPLVAANPRAVKRQIQNLTKAIDEYERRKKHEAAARVRNYFHGEDK